MRSACVFALLQLVVSGVAAPQSARGQSSAFVLARVLADEGRVDEARAAWQEALREQPNEAFVRAEHARFLWRAGELTEAQTEATLAAKLAPTEPEVARLRAQIAFARADGEASAVPEARAAFEELRRLRPGDLEALVSLSQLALAADDAAKATELLSEAARHHSGQPMVLSMLAEAARRSGDLASAERALRELLGLDPTRLPVRLQLAEVVAARGDHRGAVTLLAGAPAGQQADPQLRRRHAFEVYRAGDLAVAEREANELVTAGAEGGAGLYLRALVRLADGRASEALEDLKTLHEATPDNTEITVLLARANERSGKIEQAEALLAALAERLRSAEDRTLALDVRLEQIALLRRSEHYEEAFKNLAAAASELPEAAAVLAEQRVEILVAQEKYAEALAAWEQLPAAENELGRQAMRAELLFRVGRQGEFDEALGRLVAAPSADAWALAAEVLQRLGEHRRAIPLLEKVVAERPEAVRPLFALGVALERSGQVEGAVAVLRKALALDANLAVALNYLAYLWAERSENLDEAQEFADRAVRDAPDNGAYVDTLAWVHFRRGAFAEARTLLERANRLEPGDPTILEHLGDLAVAAGRSAEARRYFAASLEKGGERREVVESKLKGLGGSPRR